MRVTHESLLKVSRETTEMRVRKDRSIAAVYLCGSLLQEDYALGGAADVDLVFIHIDTPAVEREISALTEEVTLDIAHHPQQMYKQGKQLRLHPWLGPTLYSCKVLHDPQHLIDFIQASVRGQFDRPDYVYTRVLHQFEQARLIWTDLQTQKIGQDVKNSPQAAAQDLVKGYLRSLGHVANAVASLSGPPLTERRLLLEFQARADAAGKSGLYPGLLGLLGSPNVKPGDYPHLIEMWEQVFRSLPEDKVSARLHPARHAYYARAFSAFVEQNKPEAVLWPLLRTLVQALEFTEAETAAQQTALEILTVLGLQGEPLHERVLALDSYLDLVEETLEQWAQANGV